MERELLTTLYEHFTWARNRLLDAAAPLSAGQLSRAAPGAFGSIRDTLAHMAASEWMWLERIEGRSPETTPGGADFPTLAALRAWWDEAHSRSMAYLQRADAAELAREIRYQRKGQEYHRLVWHALLHVPVHQAEHRAQIAAQLTAFGIQPPATDLVVFLNQR